MKQTAWIAIRRHELPWGRYYDTYEWEGPRTGVTLVDLRRWERLNKEAPWPLRQLPIYCVDLGAVYVVRADGLNRFSWIYRSALAYLRNATAGFRARIILTLMVWGWAEVPNGGQPAWAHVRVVLRRRWGAVCGFLEGAWRAAGEDRARL